MAAFEDQRCIFPSVNVGARYYRLGSWGVVGAWGSWSCVTSTIMARLHSESGTGPPILRVLLTVVLECAGFKTILTGFLMVQWLGAGVEEH